MAIPLYNVKFILLISASFITIFSSIAIYFCLPILISHVIRNQLSLSPSSGSFNDWRLNSVVDRIYLYNITNLSDLIDSNTEAAKHSSASTTTQSKIVPILKQVGPFTFRQDREKLNIKFDTSNETVIYDQRKRWYFLPELSSVKTLEDLNSTWIYHMNLPLAGTTLNAEYAEFIQPIVMEFDLKLFLNHSVNVLLFEGYPDILMEQAKTQNQIDVDKFGWMYNQNNSISENIRIFTGLSNVTSDKFGSVDQYNFMKRLELWHNNNTELKDTSNVHCNEFRFSSMGEFFPPSEYSIINQNNNQYQSSPSTANSMSSDDLNTITKSASTTIQIPNVNIESIKLSGDSSNELSQDLGTINKKEGKTISLFMPDLCRTFKLTYNYTYNYKNIVADRYIANEFTYHYSESSNPTEINESSEQKQKVGDNKNSNKCFCIYNEHTKLTSCPPNGMMDLFTCRKGSPLTISFPHFLYSNRDDSLAPYLKLFEDDTEPNESEHQFYIDLESTLNVPVKAQIVIQFNVHYKNEPTLNFTHDYSFLFDNPNSKAQQSRPLTDFYLPQMWFKSTAEIDERNLNNLKFIQHHLKFITPFTTIVTFGVASILLIMSAKLAYDLTYGPKLRKSISRDQESCSSLNRNDSSYLDNKQKYYAMQLLGSEKPHINHSSNNINNNSSSLKDRNTCENHDDTFSKPTTSRTSNDFVSSESQPLNR